MKLCVRNFNFKFADREKQIEGVLFYDSEVINEDLAEKIINDFGVDMDNKVFTKDAPCFFLPKAQADMLRQFWVNQKVDNKIDDIVNELEEYKKIAVNIPSEMAVESCINIINNSRS